MSDQPYRTPGSDLGVGTRLSDGRYEFDEIENATIRKTATRARIWGIVSIVIGVLSVGGIAAAYWAASRMQSEIVSGLPNAVILALTPIALVYLVIGWFYLGCARAMKAVVETEGDDVELMMNGLAKMTAAFKVEAITTIVAIAVGVIGGIVATMGSGAGGAM